jgi:hypothetical protein
VIGWLRVAEVARIQCFGEVVGGRDCTNSRDCAYRRGAIPRVKEKWSRSAKRESEVNMATITIELPDTVVRELSPSSDEVS